MSRTINPLNVVGKTMSVRSKWANVYRTIHGYPTASWQLPPESVIGVVWSFVAAQPDKNIHSFFWAFDDGSGGKFYVKHDSTNLIYPVEDKVWSLWDIFTDPLGAVKDIIVDPIADEIGFDDKGIGKTSKVASTAAIGLLAIRELRNKRKKRK